jgi:hypothetical protein
VFHVPLDGFVNVVCASNVPGLLLEVLEYTPTATWLAVFVLLIYKVTCAAVPVAVAVYWNASAVPELLSSLLPATFWSPNRTTCPEPGVGVGVEVLVGVEVRAAVEVGVAAGVDVLVGVAVAATTGVSVAVGVNVGVLVGAGVAVMVGAGFPPLPTEASSDAGELLHVPPADQLDGKLVRLDCALPKPTLPDGVSRNWRACPPAGARSASQYVVPAVTDAAGTETLFQAPFATFVSVPCVRRAPGCPAASAYMPRTTDVAVFDEST